MRVNALREQMKQAQGAPLKSKGVCATIGGFCVPANRAIWALRDLGSVPNLQPGHSIEMHHNVISQCDFTRITQGLHKLGICPYTLTTARPWQDLS
jgi:hypothetical protein